MKKKNFLFIVLLFFISRIIISPAFAGSPYNESFKILKKAVEKKIDLGHKMTRDDLKYQLLSMKVKENIPYLVKTIRSDEKAYFRTRAFYTLALIGPDEHENTLKFALSDKRLNPGDLCIRLARANKRKYAGLIRDTFRRLKKDEPYSLPIIGVVESLAMLNTRSARDELKAYFQQVYDDPQLLHQKSRRWIVNNALYDARNVLKGENLCRKLLRKLMSVNSPRTSVPAACTLYCYRRESEARKFFKINNDKIKITDFFDKYDYFLKVYEHIDREFGEYLLKLGIKSKDINPDMKIRFLEVLAKEHDTEAQEWLKEMYKNREKNFEKALWLLAIYYNDKWITDKITKLYKEDPYWTPAKAKERAFLAQAYLVVSTKRSVGLFKRMLTDVNLLKKAYGCEGLRYQNARGTKAELKSLFAKMDYSNLRHNAVSFQCARGMFRFGKRHYIVKLLKAKEIPVKMKQLGLASLGDTGDKEDIELLKHILDKIPPSLYDSYLYALVGIGCEKTFLLTAENQGGSEEPLRDARFLMKEVLKHSDMNFRRKAAGYIEFFTYHWQAIPLLKDCVQSRDPDIKIQGILSFRNVKDPTTIGNAMSAMRRCFTDGDFRVKTAVSAVYGRLENRKRGWE
ncbi:MAG: hypothetical protein K8T10_15050 [Candidatus Eremiobacteraeota bacterium]|nr:hypothetical protein [Candidatus Eremiobacteraeota bacterium]